MTHTLKHQITALCLPWMHDILEGVAKYDLSLILYHLISKEYFSLEQLNYRIINFEYGPTVTNKPAPIAHDELLNCKIRMSANEMLTFIQCLDPMVGYFVPSHDRPWHLFLILKEIVDIFMCRDLPLNTLDLLDRLITAHRDSLKKKTIICLF